MATTDHELRPDFNSSIVEAHDSEQAILAHLVDVQQAEDRGRVVGGGLITLAAAATGVGIAWATKTMPDAQITASLPFVSRAQEAVNGIDDGLIPIGQVLIPTAIAAVGATKLAARYSSAAEFADKFSSGEPNSDGRRHTPLSRVRRVGMAAVGAMLATFTASISTEVSNGPNRTVDALNDALPGNSVVVQYDGAMPMVTSNLNVNLQHNLEAKAAERHVTTHSFSLSLGTYIHEGESRTNLIAGIQVPTSSPLHWELGSSCVSVPVALDKASGLHKGEHANLNGIDAVVVDTIEGTSSMNRVSGVMDERALKACIEQNPNAPSYGVTMETDQETAEVILQEAQRGVNAPATVISREKYINNSQIFWESNVQPITNVLSLAAGTMAFLAMAGAMSSRLLRNRRELASMLADGASTSLVRFAEVIRSTKDGILATAVGVTAAVPTTIAANTLESGFRAGVGAREMLIGGAIGLLGTIGGGALSLLGLRRIADPAEHTRV